jgi:hypothetical protein
MKLVPRPMWSGLKTIAHPRALIYSVLAHWISANESTNEKPINRLLRTQEPVFSVFASSKILLIELLCQGRCAWFRDTCSHTCDAGSRDVFVV